MLSLNTVVVRKAPHMDQTFGATKESLATPSARPAIVQFQTPLRVSNHDAVSFFMPTYIKTDSGETLAIKIVALLPKSPSQGSAHIQTAVLVLEYDTGRPMTLLEGSTLTDTRAGAESGAAIALLARTIPPTVSIWDLHPDSLMESEHIAHTESKTDINIGVIASVENRAADLALILPQGEKTQHITYGGLPRSVACWVVNPALDLLIQRAVESD